MTSKLFSIRCERQRGMLSRILSVFERPGFEVLSLGQSGTDIRGILLVSMEVALPAERADGLLRQLERIAGVIDVLVSFGEFARVGYFRLGHSAVDREFWQLLQRHGATVADWSEESLLLQKQGSLAELEAFYNVLEGPALLGSCQQVMPVNAQGLIGLE